MRIFWRLKNRYSSRVQCLIFFKVRSSPLVFVGQWRWWPRWPAHSSKGKYLNCHWFVRICLFIQLCTAALRLIVRSWLDVPTFATRCLHACHHARAPSGGTWNCGREMSGNFAEMTISTPFRDRLHAVKLRHGTDGFTSPPKEGVLRIFSP